MPDLSSLRRDYSLKSLDENWVDRDPFVQFGTWFSEAGECISGEVNAMVLATADQSGKPSSRVVLLKSFSDKGFVFFTNYASAKGNDLEVNPRAALLFFWHELERQVRIEGQAEKVSPGESSEYFAVRPRLSQIGAHASEQSKAIASRKVLEDKFHQTDREFQGKDIPRPSHWGGFLIRPEYFEFWQGRRNRLHDRIFYRFESGLWTKGRLSP